jgi:hypothetical protein
MLDRSQLLIRRGINCDSAAGEFVTRVIPIAGQRFPTLAPEMVQRV